MPSQPQFPHRGASGTAITSFTRDDRGRDDARPGHLRVCLTVIEVALGVEPSVNDRRRNTGETKDVVTAGRVDREEVDRAIQQ